MRCNLDWRQKTQDNLQPPQKIQPKILAASFIFTLSSFIAFIQIMDKLRITTVQSTLHWKDAQSNRSLFDQKLKSLAGQTDLVILPEMFTTGFSMEPADVAEKMDGPSIQWMQDKARQLGAALTGSLILKEDGHYFNRLIWMRPDGTFEQYDKRHLFTLAGEHEVFTAGKEKTGHRMVGVEDLPNGMLRPPLPGLEPQCRELGLAHLRCQLARKKATPLENPVAGPGH